MLKRTTILLLFTYTLTYCDNCPKCSQLQAHGMRSVDCYDLDLEQIPRCLRSDTQVIELSHNRIRKITRDDLSQYSSLRILYLDDNMIMNIEDGSLKDKTSLEILHLSKNSFARTPAIIFHLPSLSKLYFSHNQNTNIVQDILNLKPITSPLTYLEIAYNDMHEFPDLGMLPTLSHLNISGNGDMKTDVSKFVGICNLKALYCDNTSLKFEDTCECLTLQKWLEKRGVEFCRLNCQPNIDCDTEVSANLTESFNECTRRYDEAVWTERMIKIVLPASVSTFIVLIIIIIACCIMKKRKYRRRIREERNQPAAKGLL